MKEIWQKISTKVPDKYKDEFERQIIKDNFSRLTVLSIILVCIECVIYFVVGPLFNSGGVIKAFFLINIILIPMVLYMNSQSNTIHIWKAKIAQHIYAFSVLLFGIFLALVCQGETDLVHMYVMTVFAVIVIINMMPKESLILLVVSYIIFWMLLPNYQNNTDVILVIRENTLVFNIFAWLQSRMVLKMRLSLFLDKKLIQENNLKLKEIAKRDPMTGLLNHVTSFDTLKEEIDKANSLKYPISLIVADIDNFKQVNDNCGHLAGDQVIIKLSQSIIETVRPTDIVGRYGGEEYIIILPNTDIKFARVIANRIQMAISKVNFGIDMQITLSGGISQYCSESIEAFIKITDDKLYKAKGSGKNKFVS